MKDVTFGNLYAFIEENSKRAWKHDSFGLVEEFCQANHLDFKSLKPVLQYFGGFDDIEVLLNVSTAVDAEAFISGIHDPEEPAESGLEVNLSIPASAKAWHDKRQQAFLDTQSEQYDEAQAEKHDEELESGMNTIYAVFTGTSSFVNGVLVEVPRDPKEVAEEIRQATEAYYKQKEAQAEQ